MVSEAPHEEITMTTINKIVCAAALVALATPAQAEKVSFPAAFVGTWCETEVATEADGWMFFKRGKCPAGHKATLILKRNGDYVLDDGDHEVRCKIDPKSYFKGWADYSCDNTFGFTTKHHQKFTFDGRILGRSSLD
jgi:hypothetical protein